MFKTLRAAALAALPFLSPASGFAQSASAVTVPSPIIIKDSNTGDMLCMFRDIAPKVQVLLVPTSDAEKVQFAMAAQVVGGAKAYFTIDPADKTRMNVAFRNIARDAPRPLSNERLGEIVNRYNDFIGRCDIAYDAFQKVSPVTPHALSM